MEGDEITFSLVTKSVSPQNRFSMDITQKCPKADLWHLLGVRELGNGLDRLKMR